MLAMQGLGLEKLKVELQSRGSEMRRQSIRASRAAVLAEN